MVSLGLSLVLAAAEAATAARTLDPGIEALLTFVTDGKGMSKLRGKGVVARFQGIIPVKQTEKAEHSWVFQGTAEKGAIASAVVNFEDGPEFLDAIFTLRSEASPELRDALVTRLEGKLGKPAYLNASKDKAYARVAWYIRTAWEVSVEHDRKKPGQVILGVTQYREPEEGG
jgi:hypothetical protein